jgi:hypothetical protein
MAKRTPLVCQQLENISREALGKYQDIIRQYVRRRHGVYALYRRGELQYAGLARKRGEKTAVIRSGNGHGALKFRNRYPLLSQSGVSWRLGLAMTHFIKQEGVASLLKVSYLKWRIRGASGGTRTT